MEKPRALQNRRLSQHAHVSVSVSVSGSFCVVSVRLCLCISLCLFLFLCLRLRRCMRLSPSTCQSLPLFHSASTTCPRNACEHSLMRARTPHERARMRTHHTIAPSTTTVHVCRSGAHPRVAASDLRLAPSLGTSASMKGTAPRTCTRAWACAWENIMDVGVGGGLGDETSVALAGAATLTLMATGSTEIPGSCA